MSLVDRIQEDLVASIKAHAELRTSVLRMMKTALKNKQVELMRALEDAEAHRVLETLIKQRREAIEQFTRGGRADLAEKETREIAIIEEYLPAAATAEDMRAAVRAAVAETGASGMKDMGAVMKAAKARLAGRIVDGKTLSDLVRSALSVRA